jgi:hypothetical protein
VNRETRIGLALVAGLGALVFGLLVATAIFGTPNTEQLEVSSVLTAKTPPAERFGDTELRIIGWYAEIKEGCQGDSGGVDGSVAWLQAECPVRVLLPTQPSENVTQAELLRDGLRLSATSGEPFPPRAHPDGPNLQLDQLIFDGHFDDATAANCVAERQDRCRNTFVVSDYINILGR